jgi:hypothetical protein
MINGHAQRRRERTIPSPRTAVHLHIDELSLNGVASVEAGRLARALEANLAVLAPQPDARFLPTNVERTPAARIVAGQVPEQTGAAVAASIWHCIAGARQGGR